jgi:hypothetical protein
MTGRMLLYNNWKRGACFRADSAVLLLFLGTMDRCLTPQLAHRWLGRDHNAI